MRVRIQIVAIPHEYDIIMKVQVSHQLDVISKRLRNEWNGYTFRERSNRHGIKPGNQVRAKAEGIVSRLSQLNYLFIGNW